MQLFNENSIKRGLLLGIGIPLLIFPLVYGFFVGFELLEVMSDQGFRPSFKERTSMLVAIAANAYLLNKFQPRRATESMRGIVIATSIYIIIWVVLYGKTVFEFEGL